MTYIIAEPCIDIKDRSCVDVCPVDCIHEYERILVIDPEECIDSLLAEIRKILRTQGQHNIALVGAGRLGQAIASSPIFAEHGINIAAIFDNDPERIGRTVGSGVVLDAANLKNVVHDENIFVGVLAVPASSAQRAADELLDVGVKIIFNYSEALLDVPNDIRVLTANPAAELIAALYLQLG